MCSVLHNNVELFSAWLFSPCCFQLLRSALTGCFTVRLISVAHTEGRKHREENIYFQYFLLQLYRRGKLYCIYNAGIREMLLICGALETAFKCTIAIHFSLSRFVIARTLFILWSGSTLPHILQDQMLVSGAQDL